MAQTAFTVRMNKDLKEEFEAMCDNFGLSLTGAINLFARAVVNKKSIPFSIEYNDNLSLKEGKKDFETLRKNAKKNGTSGMSLEEINKEIYA